MAKKEKRSSSAATLPIEIIEMILTKSSPKSLLRFKTVSKSWNTIISDPLFVQNHFMSSNSSNNLFLYRHKDPTKGFTLVKLEGKKFHAQAVLDSPSGYNNAILCECNGVLLLSKDLSPNNNYLLWNPSTRAHRYLYYPYGPHHFENPGICYDPITDDFKVIMIAQTYYGIYSCKNNSWTKRELGMPCNGFYGYGIFVDGATYWVLYSGAKTELVYFDPGIDELKRLQKPGNDPKFVSLVCLIDKLCLCKTSDDGDKAKFQIWIKEKGKIDENPNWKELITIEYWTTRFCWWSGLLCYVGNKILIGFDETMLVYYSLS